MTTTLPSDLPGFFSAEVERDPYAYYRQLRAIDPVHFDPQLNGYMLTLHADVGTAYRSPIFSSRSYEQLIEPVFGRSLLQMDGIEHSRKRKLVSPYFVGRGLETWRPIVEQNILLALDQSAERTVDRLTRQFAVGATVDLVRQFASYFPVYVITDMLGLPHADYDRFLGWYTAHTKFIGAFGQDPEIDRLGRAATAELWEYLTPIIAERRRAPGPDLISRLVTAEVDGETLDDVEVKTHVTQLLNAGSETTGKTLVSMMFHLLSERERFELVRDDRSMLVPAISETLRYTPPSQMNSRQTTEDVELHGVVVPSGSLVLLVIGSANRDERRFAHPDVFDLARTDLDHERVFTSAGEHFAFGSGRHFCLGARLARTELELAATVLMDRFPDLRLADGFVPSWKGVKARSLETLDVTL